MLKIRLQRVGRKHDPVFRLVVVDSKRGPQSGNFLEILGNYDARHEDKNVFKAERIKHWMGHGALLSDTVNNLLIENKVIKGKKINVLPKKSPVIKEKEEEENKSGGDASSAKEAPADDIAKAKEESNLGESPDSSEGGEVEGEESKKSDSEASEEKVEAEVKTSSEESSSDKSVEENATDEKK